VAAARKLGPCLMELVGIVMSEKMLRMIKELAEAAKS
jgi:hypothetical protein